MTVVDWVYIAGWAWTMRYAVGVALDFIDDQTYSDHWEAEDYIGFGVMVLAGGLVCLVWPLVWLVRFTYRGYRMLDNAGHGDILYKVFPTPKKIESREERHRREEREARDREATLQAEKRLLENRIRRLEQENGIAS